VFVNGPQALDSDCAFVVAPAPRLRPGRRGHLGEVFLFFSNRLGCVGSLLVSAVLTVVVIAIIRLLSH
jgi:hypothetical protein